MIVLNKLILFQSNQERQKIELEEAAAIWNKPVADNIVIDKAKEDEIKNVMSGFVLPQSSIPQWARNMSEEEFSSHVRNKIHSKNVDDLDR